MRCNGLTTTEVIINIRLPTASLSPSEVREIVGNMGCNLVNSVEKCFYNHVNIDISVMDLIHTNLRLGMLPNKRDATSAVASTMGTCNLRATGSASHNDFQQHFSEVINTNRSSASTSTSTSERRTSTSSATNFVNNSLWMENSTYNRDYLENNFAHNMVHQVHNGFVGYRL